MFGLVKPRMAGLWHTLLSPQVIPLIFSELGAVYDGPVVQTQDLTVFNVTKEAVVARQAQVLDQLPPIPGEPRVAYTPVAPTPPDWWAEALIPLDDPRAIRLTPYYPPAASRTNRSRGSSRRWRWWPLPGSSSMVGPAQDQGRRLRVLHVGRLSMAGVLQTRKGRRGMVPLRTVSSPERPRAWIGVSELGHEGCGGGVCSPRVSCSGGREAGGQTRQRRHPPMVGLRPPGMRGRVPPAHARGDFAPARRPEKLGEFRSGRAASRHTTRPSPRPPRRYGERNTMW